MKDLELIIRLAKIDKENEEILAYIRELEDALFKARDYGALGLARSLEQELIKAKTSISKSAIYNVQLNQLLKEHYGGES